MNKSDIHIGHSGDAINLIKELLEDKDLILYPVPYREKLESALEALKDAIERRIV